MRSGLGLRVDPGMEMQEMGVDRWGHGAGVGIDAQLAVMSGAPDRCAAPFAASAIEIGLQAGAATLPAISIREAGVGGDKAIPARFEPIKLTAGGENIGGEDGDVAQRPGEQRGDDVFRKPRRPVLPDVPVACDASGCLSGPGLKREASASEVVTIVIKIGDHFEEVADDDGSPGRIVTKMTGIGIDQCLIDTGNVEPSEPLTGEGEEPASTVEYLAYAGGW